MEDSKLPPLMTSPRWRMTAGCQIDRGTNCIARAFRTADQLQTDPVVVVVIDVAEQHRRVVHAVDDHIDLAVVEEIAECRAAGGNYVGEASALDRGHDFKLLAVIEVMEQQRRVRPRRCPSYVDRPADIHDH